MWSTEQLSVCRTQDCSQGRGHRAKEVLRRALPLESLNTSLTGSVIAAVWRGTGSGRKHTRVMILVAGEDDSPGDLESLLWQE